MMIAGVVLSTIGIGFVAGMTGLWIKQATFEPETLEQGCRRFIQTLNRAILFVSEGNSRNSRLSRDTSS